MTSTIQFQGPGPFDLPVAQRATAAAETDTVTLMFRIAIDGGRQETVRIAILNNQVLELMGQIARALESQGQNVRLTKPYMEESVIPTVQALPDSYRYGATLADHRDEASQKERLSILTHVPLPLQTGRQGLHLTALLRVRELLDQQIRAMQSP